MFYIYIHLYFKTVKFLLKICVVPRYRYEVYDSDVEKVFEST